MEKYVENDAWMDVFIGLVYGFASISIEMDFLQGVVEYKAIVKLGVDYELKFVKRHKQSLFVYHLLK